MSKYLILLYLLSISLISYGQSLVTDQAQISFGEVSDNTPISLPLVITNQSNELVNVVDLQFYDTYNSPAFFANNMSFGLEPGESKTIEITFSPLHNIYHNTELFIVTEHRGAFSVDLVGQGVYDNAYYFDTRNKEGEALKDELTEIIGSNTVDLGYNSIRDQMYMEVDNQAVNGQGAPENTLQGVYTGQIITGFNSRSQVQDMDFNAEHTWPQSKGASSQPMRSDMFHLYPTNESANSRRGNKKLGIVDTPIWQSGGSKDGNDGIFEPRDEQKGRSARSLLYFATRYQEVSSVELSWFFSQETTMRQWNLDFPPDSVEMARNEAIFGLQNNRNPFIDYPQFVDRIDNFTNEDEVTVTGIDIPYELVDFGYINEAGEYMFALPVYNLGETDLILNNFDLVASDKLDLVGDESEEVTIAPGEDHLFVFTLTSTGSGTEIGEFQFNTNLSDTEIEVPIYANVDVGAPKINLNEAINLFPNPTKDVLNLSITEPLPFPKEVTIFNTTGGKVFQETITQLSYQISTQDYPDGVYWLHLNYRNEVWVRPFVVQH